MVVRMLLQQKLFALVILMLIMALLIASCSLTSPRSPKLPEIKEYESEAGKSAAWLIYQLDVGTFCYRLYSDDEAETRRCQADLDKFVPRKYLHDSSPLYVDPTELEDKTNYTEFGYSDYLDMLRDSKKYEGGWFTAVGRAYFVDYKTHDYFSVLMDAQSLIHLEGDAKYGDGQQVLVDDWVRVYAIAEGINEIYETQVGEQNLVPTMEAIIIERLHSPR